MIDPRIQTRFNELEKASGEVKTDRVGMYVRK